MATSYTKLSNVIGAPFSDTVLHQLYIRAAHSSTLNRTNEEVLFLANKTGWARLVSSVNIELKGDQLKNFYTDLGITGDAALDKNPDTLAKNWILEAGTAISAGNGIKLREGIGPDGAYGLGGTEEMGYRPMPGLTSVQIETTGRLGSLRQATISFKVWNMNQLNVIEALYFRLGYSMLLEWGHTQYFENDHTFKTSGIFGVSDPFAGNLRKEAVQQNIAKKAKQSFGNYDGMLGIVSNFTWSFNQDGGYDCTVKLVGLGAIMDSLRVNQSYTLPPGAVQEFKKAGDVLQAATELAAQLKAAQEEAKRLKAAAAEDALKPKPKLPPANLNDLYEYARKLDDYIPNIDVFTSSYQYYPNVNPATQETTTAVPDYYYLSTAKGAGDQADYNKNYFGLFIQKNGAWWKRVKVGDVFSIQTAVVDKAAKSFVDVGSKGDVDYYALSKNKKTGKDYSWLGKVLSVQSRTPVVLEETISGNSVIVELNDPLNEAKISFINEAFVGPASNSFKKQFITTVSFENTYRADYSITRQQVFDAFDEWYMSPNAGLTLRSITPDGSGITQSVRLRSNVDIVIPQVKNSGPNRTYPPTKDLTIKFTFEFNNTYYINELLGNTVANSPTKQQAQTANSGDTEGTANQAGVSPVDSPSGYESALQVMLVYIQTVCQQAALPGPVAVPAVAVKDAIKKITEAFYQDGSLAGVLTSTDSLVNSTTVTANPNGVAFDLVAYGKKGYNSNLMVDQALFNLVADVDFDKLCTAYVVKYPQGDVPGSPDMIHSPVYIQLGYLLAFLNNMCLIYDSAQKATTAANTTTNTKRPYVYIDFNPETNFCLTSPQQLSVDPFTCLIPFNASSGSYGSIYDPEIYKNLNNKFNPEESNVLTKFLNDTGLDFKTANPYQGKMMNILLNVDYLLKVVKNHAASDAEHAVNLQPFLSQILTDINKCLGNTNAFRVAYRDDSNTIQILDDQWAPSLSSETSMLERDPYLIKLKTEPRISGQLPIFGPAPGELPVAGAQSLARQFQLKTTLSTKLASMIAISAQAATSSVNAKDHSSLSYLNENYYDRYKRYVQDPTVGGVGTNTNTPSIVSSTANNQLAAQLFNDHIVNVYSDLLLSADKIETARNYYIERMSKVKSGDPITSAAPFIPADLEMTIDGISGIIMGNAFTIPEDRLPRSLRGSGGFTKVAFIVTGLTHTIQNNEWLTRIKGQMIKLRENTKTIKSTTTITQAQLGFTGVLPTGPDQVNTTFVASNSTAKAAAELYLGRPMTDNEWTMLISATFAEASANQKERAYVVGVILNRARSSKQTIQQVLTAKNQFQSVTGTARNGHQPSPQFRNGPNPSSADSIYGAIVNILREVPKTYLYFTAANLSAYGPGTNPGYITELAKRGGIVIGQTIFSA